jgi:drug/metabolite transporter (DMT)-like permease
MIKKKTLSTTTGSTVPFTALRRPRFSALWMYMAQIRLVLLSVLLAAVGQLTFKAALNEIGGLSLSLEMFVKLATSPLMLLGMAIFAGSALLWLIALMKTDLSFAYPFLSLSYVLVLLGGALLFKEAITPLRVLGFLVIVIGLFVVASSAEKENDDGRQSDSTS